MKSHRYLSLAVFAAFALLFFFFRGLIEKSLLEPDFDRFKTSLLEIRSIYIPLRNLNESKIPAGLQKANSQILSRNSLGVDYLLNYDRSWNLLTSAVKSTDSRQAVRMLHEEIVKTLPDRMTFVPANGGAVCVKMAFPVGKNLTYTVVGFHAPEYYKRRNFVTLTSWGLFGVLSLLFLIVMFLPGNTRRLQVPVERGYKVSRQNESTSFRVEVPNLQQSNAKVHESPEKNADKFYRDTFSEKTAPAAVKSEPEKKEPVAVMAPPKGLTQAPSAGEIRSFEEIFEYKKGLEKQVEELSVLREINLASNTISDTKEFFSTVLKIIQNKFDCERVELLLSRADDPKSLDLNAALKGGEMFYPEKDDPTTPKIGLGIGDEGKAVERENAIILSNKNGSTLCAPLVDKGKITGAIRLHAREGAAFNESDKFILMKLARHAAVGVNNVTLYETAVTDGMTGLYNHKHFQHLLREELGRSERYKDPLSLALFDIDFFKRFNDTYGHQAGDYVLKQFAALLKSQIRRTDVAFRYGGEEFSALFIRTGAAAAKEVAEKIRQCVENTRFEWMGQTLRVTVSVGVSTVENRSVDADVFIKETDKALYFCKEHGRNRVTVFQDI